MTTQDEKIAQDVEQLRIQFPKTTDLYREVCALLFFRYGMQPTANKLYQLVRKGTMSTPATVLNQFWKDLREKSRLQIDHPGIPEHLKVFAGEVISNLWLEAIKASENNFNDLSAEINKKMITSNLELQIANKTILELSEYKAQIESNLESTKNRLLEAENKMMVDAQILTTQEKSLVALENEKLRLQAQLKETQVNFVAQIDKLHSSLQLSDQRFRALESKSLQDVDRERQRSKNLEKELVTLNRALNKEQQNYKTLAIKQQKHVNQLTENIGLIKGQLKECQKQNARAMKRLK